MTRKKGKLEFRYYEIPFGEPLLALFGDSWIQTYGYDSYDQRITDLHFHNLLEIGYCYEGSGEMQLENSSQEYESGTITVIPRNYPHTTYSQKGQICRWEYLFIDVERLVQLLYPEDDRYASRLCARINRQAFCTTSIRAPLMAMLIRTILKEMEQKQEMYDEVVRGLLRALFAEIFRQSPDSSERELPAAQKHPEFLQISDALEFIGAHYGEALKVKNLADVCHMSETHFRRLFTRYMGMHPVDYVNRVRIRMACERLKKTTESISDVAEKCGFASLVTFNRNFRKYMGITPNEWKKAPEAFERRMAGKRIAVLEGW